MVKIYKTLDGVLSVKIYKTFDGVPHGKNI